MASNFERLTHLNTDVSFGTDGDFLVRHANMDLDIGGEEWDADAGSVGYSQWTPGRKRISGTITFETGGNETPADLPEQGDLVNFFAIRDRNGVDILPDINDRTKYGKIGCTGVRLRASDRGVWTAEVGIRSGLLENTGV